MIERTEEDLDYFFLQHRVGHLYVLEENDE